jgi:hypothetical protein
VTLLSSSHSTQATIDSAQDGERVLSRAVMLARGAWADRLVAAYAMGSLAHGGFSPHVSDVDLGLVLEAPLGQTDARAVGQLAVRIAASGLPLSERLSVFWGSVETLSGAASGGRFPPLDMLDLKQFGRLLAGQDIRDRVRAPTRQELVVSGAEFALQYLSKQAAMDYLRKPADLASARAKKLTKLVLLPVRLLYTARTGNIGINDDAAKHFCEAHNDPAAELARGGLSWRRQPPLPGDPIVIEQLVRGLRSLYQIFLCEYEERLLGCGASGLARAFREWRARLTGDIP